MATNIGPRIQVDGEKEYRQQMSAIIQQTKTLSAELKLLTSGYGQNDSALTKAQNASRILTQQITEQKKAVSQMSDMLKKSADAYGESDTRTQKYQQNVYNAQAELAKMESQLQKVDTQLRVEQSVTAATASAWGKFKSDVSLATNAQRANQQAVAALKSDYNEAKARVSALTKEVASSAKAHGDHADETRELADQLADAQKELDRLGSELTTARSKLTGFAGAVDNLGGKLKGAALSGINNLGSAIKGGFSGALKLGASAAQTFVKGVAAIGTAAAAGIVALGKMGLEYNAEMEGYQVNFETMLGSQEAAARKVAELKEMANKTPFEMGDLASATQQLLAMNVASEDTNTILQQLGDISLGDKNKLESLVNAFGKMNSTGKVTLENINMMAEQGFNPLNVIAQQTGESMEQLYERVSAGGVSLEEIKGAMEAATSTGGQFAGGMERASKTVNGLISNLKDNAMSLVGEVFEPISNGLREQILPGAIDAIDHLTTAFRANGIGGMVAAAGDILGNTLGQFTDALPSFAETALSIVTSLGDGIKNNQGQIANGVVKTITTLVSGLISATPQLLKTGGSLLLEIAKGLAANLPEIGRQAVNMVIELVESLWANRSQIWDAGVQIVQGIIDGIASVWGELVNWFNNIWNSLFGRRSVDVSVNTHGGGGGTWDGSHADGLRYVPFDNYIARLHQGEMVLTRSQADTLRNAGYMYLPRSSSDSGRGQPVKQTNLGGVNITIYQQSGQDSRELAEYIMDELENRVRKEEAKVG